MRVTMLVTAVNCSRFSWRVTEYIGRICASGTRSPAYGRVSLSPLMSHTVRLGWHERQINAVGTWLKA